MPVRSSLDEIKAQVARLAALIEAPQSLLPTYGYSLDGAHPHIEVDALGYHYVVRERGQETDRVTTNEFDELLYHVFKHVTFSLACQYELRNRVEGQDFRRLLFQYQVSLLAMLSPAWAERKKREHDHILESFPYDDLAMTRVDLARTLRQQGLAPEVAWRQACDRYPLP